MIVWFAFVVCACGGEGGGDDDSPAADAANAQPLTCKSIALCTTYDVKTFLGSVPAPAGGAVNDGLYRLAWVMDPDNVDEDAGYFQDLDALAIRGSSFNWAGFFRDDIGTWSTSGSVMTFKHTQNCERGSDGSVSTDMREYKYTASASELRIFSHVSRSDGVEWDRMYVYVLTSSPADVCKAVTSEPSTPGDSADCQVTNCACKFAVEGTVSECT
ncbi:MAG TPA: hypothetical protein VIV11_41195 [Kofleriaceae bacterium]